MKGRKEMRALALSHSITQSHKYRTTNDIIKAVEEGSFPRQAMMTFHPQRWHSRPLPWLKELVWQNQPVGGQV